MRLAPLLTAAALAFAAVAATAQEDAPAPGEAQAQENGLGLADTLEGLEDTPPAEAPAQTPAEPQPEPEQEAAAEPEPEPQVEAQVEAQPPESAPAAAPPARLPLVMPPEPLTRAQRAALDAAATRGRLLGVIERSGRFATQDMLSRISDPDGAGITGWIAEAEGNGVAVTFYADTDAGPVLVYRVTILGGRIVGREVHLAGTRPPLNPIQARMAAARGATAALDHQPCGAQAFNVFVVPPLTPDGPVDVYQVSPQTRRGHYPVGGHFRTSVAADGTIAVTRGYTGACLDVPVSDPAAGARPAPIAITHLLDPLPQDIHVFLAAWTGHPLVVIAGDPQRLFAVTPDGIAEIPPQGPGR